MPINDESQERKEKIKELQEFVYTSRDIREWKRGEAVILRMFGVSYQEIQKRLGVSKSLIANSQKKYTERGITGLKLGERGLKRLISEPDDQKSNLSQSPVLVYPSDGRADINSQQVLSYKAKSDRHPPNSQADSVLVRTVLEVQNGQEIEKPGPQANLSTALVVVENELQSNTARNGNDGREARTTALALPNGHSIQLPKVSANIALPLAPEKPQFDRTIINETLQHSRHAITSKIIDFIDFKRDISGGYAPLYELLKDYPFRAGKMLRPTMCISAARAVGGMGDRVLATAAALELYHNAFLIHDDIEDSSESRRGKETLHHAIGIPRAVNVGDATNVLAVGLLLENLSVIGVQKTLNVLHEIEFMAQQSVEGQAMELDYVANNIRYLTDQDYFTMCVKKTCWYSFMTPLRIGLIIGHPTSNLSELVKPLADITRFGMILGIAFQIQDDLLNLLGELETYGKEIGGDLYEGKRTLVLNHTIANSKAAEQILEILALPRPQKTPEQIKFIFEEMNRCGSIERGWQLARSLANQADELFDSLDFLKPETPLQPGEKWSSTLQDRRFLKQLINYVIYRNL